MTSPATQAGPTDAPAPPQVVLYLPALPAGDIDGRDLQQEQLALWRRLLQGLQRDWREASRVEALRALKPGVIVLPHARRLSERELRELQRLQTRGVALLATGALGLAPQPGSATRVAERLLGAALRPLREAVPTAAAALTSGGGVHVSSLGLSAVSGDLPAGTRLLFAPRAWLLDAPRGALSGAEFTDWSYAPLGGGEAPLGAVWYGRGPRDGGRWVYLGFADMNLVDAEFIAMTRLVQSTLAWLDRRDDHLDGRSARLADWPAGHAWAQLIEMDTELDDSREVRLLDRALVLGKMLEAVGARASFYCVTGDLALAPSVLERLAAAGHELGLHAERHDPFGGLRPTEQAARIAAMLAQWQQLRPGAETVQGFRAPYESYDLATQQALQAAGLGYHVSGPNDAPARLPYFTTLGPDRRLLNLPRTQPDDYGLKMTGLPAAVQQRQLRIDAQAAQRSGAFALLSVHPQHFEPTSPVAQALPALLAELRAAPRAAWLATGAEIAAWWRARERVRLTPEADGLRIDVSEGPALAGVSVIVNGDAHGQPPRVQPGSSARVDVHRWRAEAPATIATWQTELRLHDLPAGTTRLTWSAP